MKYFIVTDDVEVDPNGDRTVSWEGSRWIFSGEKAKDAAGDLFEELMKEVEDGYRDKMPTAIAVAPMLAPHDAGEIERGSKYVAEVFEGLWDYNDEESFLIDEFEDRR